MQWWTPWLVGDMYSKHWTCMSFALHVDQVSPSLPGEIVWLTIVRARLLIWYVDTYRRYCVVAVRSTWQIIFSFLLPLMSCGVRILNSFYQMALLASAHKARSYCSQPGQATSQVGCAIITPCVYGKKEKKEKGCHFTGRHCGGLCP